jgi:enoyl-CoA hydratase/carnithine racemase
VTDKPNPFKPGMNVLGQAFLRALAELWDMARRNRVILSPASGIAGRTTASGTVLSVPGAVGARYAVVQSPGLSARTGTTLGSGTIKLYARDGTTLGGPAAAAVDCYNSLTASIATSAVVVVAWADGAWVAISGDCA